MERSWELVFAFDYPVERVWSAYFELEGASEAPEAGTTFTLTDAAGTVIEITEVQENERLAYSAKAEGRDARVSVTFASTETGSEITVTHFGFGDGLEFEIGTSSQRLGWWESFCDLASYLRTGVPVRRHLTDRSSTGVVLAETPAGLEVRNVRPDSFGAQAGLEPGDLICSIDGAAVYRRTDMWLIARLYEAGREAAVEYARRGEIRTGRGRMLVPTSAASGELGLGPRIEGVDA